MTKVIISDNVAEEALEVFEANEVECEYRPGISMEELGGIIGDYDGIIVRSRTKLTKDMLEKASKLKVIGRAGIGVDNIDVDYCSQHGITVVNAPRSSTYSVAELTIGLMLALARKITAADMDVRSGGWNKKRFKGTELYGKTLGFVGSGRIGSEVARRAQAFGMRTIAYDPYLGDDVAQKVGLQLMDLDSVLSESDFLSIHAVLTDETRGMIGMDELKKMKPTAYLINCARGPIVDENALYRALSEGIIAGAALDVYEKEPPEGSPILTLPPEKVVLTPHIGAMSTEAQVRAGITVAKDVLRVLQGREPEFKVV